MFIRQLSVTQIVLRFFEVDFGNDTAGMRLIGAPLFAFRRDEGDVCQVCCLALFECQLP